MTYQFFLITWRSGAATALAGYFSRVIVVQMHDWGCLAGGYFLPYSFAMSGTGSQGIVLFDESLLAWIDTYSGES